MPGDCTVYEAQLADMGNKTNIKQIGVKTGTSATTFSGAFYIAGVRLDGTESATKN